jgi:23S rRNA pseudouridine955/2504/2580 synthase
LNDIVNFEQSRLDKYIKRKHGKLIPQSLIEKALRNKDILVNGKKASASDKVTKEDSVSIHKSVIRLFENLEKAPSQTVGYSSYIDQFEKMIVYEDNDIIIVNKPPGLAVQLGSKTKIALDVIAKAYCSELKLVHRIDKETSGLTILAKNIETSRYMLFLFQHKMVFKKYTAIVCGEMLESNGMINSPLAKIKEKVIICEKGKEAVTKFRVLRKIKNGKTMIEATPITGRTHQIRVHMASINCPILGDKKYKGPPHQFLALHSSEITFTSRTKNTIHITAPLPDHMRL